MELGGTKTLLTLGGHPLELEPVRFRTTTPEETLNLVAENMTGTDPTAIGVAAFGPIGLSPGSADYGRIQQSPKPGWRGFDLLSWITSRWDVAVALDTDVNAAAVGEWRWGAASGARQPAYLTVGTGIGGGVLVRGEPLHGDPHPEIGHIAVTRHDDDSLDGVCPYHGDCLEGLASGPALRRRFSAEPEKLAGGDLDQAVSLTAWYLAQGLAVVVMAWAPDLIVVGGGVSKLPGFHDRVARRLADLVGSYPRERRGGLDPPVVPPSLGDRSALAGAFALASEL